MKIEFHGAGQEVGRSCVEIDDTYLLDSGIKIGEIVEYPDNIARREDQMIQMPAKIDLKKIKAVFLSHAHLDHSGALPLFDHFGLNCPIFCTTETRAITEILLKDALKIQSFKQQHTAYSEYDIERVDSMMKLMQMHRKGTVGSVEFELFDAGHIPGSSCIFLKIGGKTLIYTGDINTIDTQLLHKMENLPKADILICESTYGDRDHPPREETENDFLDKVQEVIDRGGRVLIAAFAVGRAQEIMLLLNKREFNVPIYLDGMAKEVTNRFLEDPHCIRDPEELLAAVDKIQYVDAKDRKKIVQKQGIFITTSGMVTGGPIMQYLKFVYDDPDSAILLTGYQAEGTNGRMLKEQAKCIIEKKMYSVECEVGFFDFSAHAGKQGLIDLIKQVNPSTLILNHGDPESVAALAETFKDRTVFTPKTGDIIEV
ncbi:MBL fold metallo-hydrolase [Candidatus Woesearchaeota archaeon]|nr:MBL fold metallo-hydrolase [Candidatus Woesearchaeota archaeon]